MRTLAKLAAAGLGLGVLYAAVRPRPKGKPAFPLTNILPIPFTAKTGYIPDSFFDVLAAAVARWRAKGAAITGLDMLGVFNAESGYTAYNLTHTNAAGYGGLNGMGPDALKGVGFTGTMADYLALPITDQLGLAIKFYDVNVGAMAGGDYAVLSDTGRAYLLNIFPAFIRKPADYVIASRSNDPHGWYKWNAQVDVDGKGYIEVADMARFVGSLAQKNDAFFGELRYRLEQAQKRAAQEPISAASKPPTVVFSGEREPS